MTRWGILLALAVATVGAVTPATAEKKGKWGTYGDGDTFPLSCVDFSGIWEDESDQKYEIIQTGCRMIRVRAIDSKANGSYTTIVPDNRKRNIDIEDGRRVERHRWNSMKHGTRVESHMKIYLND